MKLERAKERENHIGGVLGGSTEARRTEEKRTVPLVRAGQWRLGHAWQSTVCVCVFFFFDENSECFLLIDFEFFFLIWN